MRYLYLRLTEIIDYSSNYSREILEEVSNVEKIITSKYFLFDEKSSIVKEFNILKNNIYNRDNNILLLIREIELKAMKMYNTNDEIDMERLQQYIVYLKNIVDIVKSNEILKKIENIREILLLYAKEDLEHIAETIKTAEQDYKKRFFIEYLKKRFKKEGQEGYFVKNKEDLQIITKLEEIIKGYATEYQFENVIKKSEHDSLQIFVDVFQLEVNLEKTFNKIFKEIFENLDKTINELNKLYEEFKEEPTKIPIMYIYKIDNTKIIKKNLQTYIEINSVLQDENILLNNSFIGNILLKLKFFEHAYNEHLIKELNSALDGILDFEGSMLYINEELNELLKELEQEEEKRLDNIYKKRALDER